MRFNVTRREARAMIAWIHADAECGRVDFDNKFYKSGQLGYQYR